LGSHIIIEILGQIMCLGASRVIQEHLQLQMETYTSTAEVAMEEVNLDGSFAHMMATTTTMVAATAIMTTTTRLRVDRYTLHPKNVGRARFQYQATKVRFSPVKRDAARQSATRTPIHHNAPRNDACGATMGARRHHSKIIFRGRVRAALDQTFTSGVITTTEFQSG